MPEMRSLRCQDAKAAWDGIRWTSMRASGREAGVRHCWARCSGCWKKLEQRVSCLFYKSQFYKFICLNAPLQVLAIISPGSTHEEGTWNKSLNISAKKDSGGVIYSHMLHLCLGMLDLIPDIKAWQVSAVPQGYNHSPGRFSKCISQ